MKTAVLSSTDNQHRRLERGNHCCSYTWSPKQACRSHWQFSTDTVHAVQEDAHACIAKQCTGYGPLRIKPHTLAAVSRMCTHSCKIAYQTKVVAQFSHVIFPHALLTLVPSQQQGFAATPLLWPDTHDKGKSTLPTHSTPFHNAHTAFRDAHNPP